MATTLKTPVTWPRLLLPSTDGRDPADLDGAVAAGAFEGLKRAVRELGPTGTIATIAASGLRGRGGAGFPTAEKWRLTATTDARRRYAVANGYGADPATFTDRTLLRENPFAVIEGLAVAAFSVGADEAFIAVRGEDLETIRLLEAAVGAAEEAGFIGHDILDSGHDVIVTVRPVQGAYMLGEETVLLKALEGRRGQPEQRPPHPAQQGLFRMPTVVQNVQTLAAVPWILANGAEAHAAIGSKASPGTILVQVRGGDRDGVA
jgi:NADH:ubiquinone oxidoreductase subunit F (NADH-binding)